MRAIIQRCNRASVRVNGKTVGAIQNGVMILVGFTYGDTEKEIDYVVDKIINLRIFDDDDGVMNKSIIDVGGSILSISQFTLYADTRKGRRPSYINALNGKSAVGLYDIFNEKLSKSVHVETGIFGADMELDNVFDGPVTIIIEKEGNYHE